MIVASIGMETFNAVWCHAENQIHYFVILGYAATPQSESSKDHPAFKDHPRGNKHVSSTDPIIVL